MVKLTAPGVDYAINVPTRIEEYTPEILTSLVEHVNLPKYYAIIALLSPVDIVRLAYTVSAKKDDGFTSVLPVICKWNDIDENNPDMSVGDLITINKSDIELGTELSVPCGCSFNKLIYFLNLNTALRDNLVKNACNLKDDEGKNLREVIVTTFKIVPISAIKAYSNLTKEGNDPFKVEI